MPAKSRLLSAEREESWGTWVDSVHMRGVQEIVSWVPHNEVSTADLWVLSLSPIRLAIELQDNRAMLVLSHSIMAETWSRGVQAGL